MGLFEELEKKSLQSVNGMKIVLNTGEEVCELSREDIVDIEKALDLASKVDSGLVELRMPNVWWAKNFTHFGENLGSAYTKFQFLLEHFVGNFDY